MRHSKWCTACGLIIMIGSSLALSGCAEPPAEAHARGSGPAQVEAIEGKDVSRVTLTPEAAERIDLSTAPIVDEQVPATPGIAGASVERQVIPYAAVIYDNTGATWAYTTREPLVYVRESIAIDYIDGDRVVLFDGPTSGTEVVTLGAAELYGAELGLGQ